MFGEKFIVSIAQKIQRKNQKQLQKANMTKKDVEKVELYKQLKNLYQFVRWVEKYSFKNRHERKSFWKSVAGNTNVMEDTVLTMAERYAKKDDKEYNAPPQTKEENKKE